MLTVDLTDASSWQEALPTAVGYCQAFGSTLHLLTVVADFGMTVGRSTCPADIEAKALEELTADCLVADRVGDANAPPPREGGAPFQDPGERPTGWLA